MQTSAFDLYKKKASSWFGFGSSSGSTEPDQPEAVPDFNNEGINLNTLQDLLRENFPKFNSSSKKDIILVIGATRAGKSTLINYMLGHRIISERGQGLTKIYRVDEQATGPRAGIGHGSESHTTIAEVFVSEKDGVNYCDCPGIFESRTSEMAILTSLSTEYAVKVAAKVSCIMLVVDGPSLVAGGGAPFLELTKTLGGILKDIEKVKDSIIVVISKTRAIENRESDALIYFLKQISETETRNAQGDPERIRDAELISKVVNTLIYAIDKKRFLLQDDQDPFGKNTDEMLLKLIKSSGLMAAPKDHFDFNNSHKKRAALNRYARDILLTASEYNVRYEEYNSVIEKYKNSLKLAENQVSDAQKCVDKVNEDLKKLKNDEPIDGLLGRGAALKSKAETEKDTAQEKLKQLNIDIQKNDEAIKDFTSQRAALDNDNLVDYPEATIKKNDSKSMWKPTGWVEIPLEHVDNIPIETFDEQCRTTQSGQAADGKYSGMFYRGAGKKEDEEVFNKNLKNGIYRSIYKSQYKIMSIKNYEVKYEVTVTFKVKSKNHPDNLKNIKILDANIAAKSHEKSMNLISRGQLKNDISNAGRGIDAAIDISGLEKDRKEDALKRELKDHTDTVEARSAEVEVNKNGINIAERKQSVLAKEIEHNLEFFDTFDKLRTADVSFPEDIMKLFKVFPKDYENLRTISKQEREKNPENVTQPKFK